jgi:hypothetical protein
MLAGDADMEERCSCYSSPAAEGSDHSASYLGASEGAPPAGCDSSRRRRGIGYLACLQPAVLASC